MSLASVPLALGALAGCGAASHPAVTKTRGGPVAHSQATGTVVPDAVVSVVSCSVRPGPVLAVGTATNPGSTTTDIDVRVEWLRPGAGTVLASGSQTLSDVAPGAKTSWRITATLPGTTVAECYPTGAVPGGGTGAGIDSGAAAGEAPTGAPSGAPSGTGSG